LLYSLARYAKSISFGLRTPNFPQMNVEISQSLARHGYKEQSVEELSSILEWPCVLSSTSQFMSWLSIALKHHTATTAQYSKLNSAPNICEEKLLALWDPWQLEDVQEILDETDELERQCASIKIKTGILQETYRNSLNVQRMTSSKKAQLAGLLSTKLQQKDPVIAHNAS
jgi:hypothetical protein